LKFFAGKVPFCGRGRFLPAPLGSGRKRGREAKSGSWFG
jgi:hypothetical protein